ncbi:MULTISPECIES: hypothetical protein [Bacillus cereus group]|nr:hypothetical protein [Bacillus cereus]MDA1997132.1 hypothetical protein [Bacillus cereus]MDA2002978.1 hypothetical protein [Bacillus cereus]MDA2518745.1 hypothetical protein [Bacillus cereus]MDA3655669.1 hypothetical protein [Bacillus cereus]WPQ43612.1 hypothetical protein SH594_13515 [Bacillus cereus]
MKESMTRHYLINSLVNWHESIRKNDIQKAYNAMKGLSGMTKDETLKMIHLYYDTGYKWYEYKHPKLRELLGEW